MKSISGFGMKERLGSAATVLVMVLWGNAPVLETDLLMVAGAGFRRAPVKFFPVNQLAPARVWLG